MKLPPPEPGLVLSYAYLWWREAKQGREEGVKFRPAVIVVAIKQEDGRTHVATVPLTTSRPRPDAEVIEVPATVKRALGLDEARSWIVVDEINRFDWPGTDVRPAFAGEGWVHGRLPPGLFRKVREAIAANARAQRLRIVPRD